MSCFLKKITKHYYLVIASIVIFYEIIISVVFFWENWEVYRSNKSNYVRACEMTRMKETEVKLRDAKIQLDLAMSRENVGNFEVVRSCINAFISDGRSVTFTMQKESGSSEKFLRWYEKKQAKMKDDPLLNFFNEQRVISIHHRSVQPLQITINIAKVEHDGKTVGVGGVALVYEFDDFDKVIAGDNGNVFRHCLEYYNYLSELVSEWKELMK